MDRITTITISIYAALCAAFLLAGCGTCGMRAMGGKEKEKMDITAFWDLFGQDYRKNCLAWRHSPDNPVIPASGDTWKKDWTANPAVLELAGRMLLYYRGNGVMPGSDGQRHDRIAVAEIVRISPGDLELRDLAGGEPIVDIGPADSFDGLCALDPTAVAFGGKVWLYYSAIGDGPDSIGLAVSEDGIHFEKVGKIMDGRAPSAVRTGETISMLYQMMGEDGRYRFFVARSADGIHFEPLSSDAVFRPEGEIGWDSHDISTGRLFATGDGFIMLYGGNSSLVDQPDYFGLARSRDLIHWERHPGNPVFGCGPKGSEDGGAIWFPALIESGDHYYLLYEGSRGNYRGDLSSQICMASIAKDALH